MYSGPVASGGAIPFDCANAIASNARTPSAHGPLVTPSSHSSPVAPGAANGSLVSKSKICPQIVCVPLVDAEHPSGAEQPPAPLPTHVVTPILSTRSSVEP